MIKSKKQKLKLGRETVVILSTNLLQHIQGGGPTQTRGVGCEPSGIIACG